MLTLFKKYSTIISLLLLLGVLVVAWLFPSTGALLGMIFVVISFVTTSFAVFEKHRKAYLQARITRIVFIRNVFFDLTGILLAIVLAGLLGRFVAEIATRRISNDLTQLIAGIDIGLLVGIVVGVLIKRASSHLVKISSTSHLKNGMSL